MIACNCALPAMRGPDVCKNCSIYQQHMNQNTSWEYYERWIPTKYILDPDWQEQINRWWKDVFEQPTETFDPPV